MRPEKLLTGPGAEWGVGYSRGSLCDSHVSGSEALEVL